VRAGCLVLIHPFLRRKTARTTIRGFSPRITA
jgi:hypothetical protein